MKVHLVKDLLMQKINIVDKQPLDKIKIITIYLGDTCNFDCVYCDRDYIKKIGSQNVTKSNLDELKEFLTWVDGQPNNLEIVNFHGGEPLLYIKRMEEIMQWLFPMAQKNKWRISMTTNGSLVKENEWFFEKYSGYLNATVSYDFMYQGRNREEFDVYSMAEVLNKHCIFWQYQFVLPIDDPKAFSFDNIKDMVSTMYKSGCRIVNVIPLRHKRGKDKFEVIIDRIDLTQFLDAFLQFLQILYVKKINVFIDGCYTDVSKAYFSDHNKFILSPDGFIYPEFDFLEYKTENARTGDWKNRTFWRDSGDEGRIHNSCMSCEKRPSCGLKYLYHLFDEQPKGNCKTFYTFMDYAIMHNARLKEKDSILKWIGIKEDFKINK